MKEIEILFKVNKPFFNLVSVMWLKMKIIVLNQYLSEPKYLCLFYCLHYVQRTLMENM